MPPTVLSAVYPSPKRKRDQPPVPLLNTALRPAASTPPRGSPTPDSSDSPRNAVADQLRGMTLAATSAIPMSPLTPTDDVMRKKPKLEAMRGTKATSPDGDANEGTLKGSSNQGIRDAHAVRALKSSPPEIPETPEARTQPRTAFSDMVAFAQPTTFSSSSVNTSGQPSTATNQRSRSQNRTSQPRQRKKSPSPPLAALTWQDSEITGHLVDPSTDPDDDGTGINGIGFRPTPAIAYARAQRRKQQVMDWKAREAREARAKRSERRRRGVGGTFSREATVERDVAVSEDVSRRTVKFAI